MPNTEPHFHKSYLLHFASQQNNNETLARNPCTKSWPIINSQVQLDGRLCCLVLQPAVAFQRLCLTEVGVILIPYSFDVPIETRPPFTVQAEMPLMFGEKIGKQEINIPAINCPSLPTQTYLGLPHLNCH